MAFRPARHIQHRWVGPGLVMGSQGPHQTLPKIVLPCKMTNDKWTDQILISNKLLTVREYGGSREEVKGDGHRLLEEKSWGGWDLCGSDVLPWPRWFHDRDLQLRQPSSHSTLCRFPSCLCSSRRPFQDAAAAAAAASAAATDGAVPPHRRRRHWCQGRLPLVHVVLTRFMFGHPGSSFSSHIMVRFK